MHMHIRSELGWASDIWWDIGRPSRSALRTCKAQPTAPHTREANRSPKHSPPKSLTFSLFLSILRKLRRQFLFLRHRATVLCYQTANSHVARSNPHLSLTLPSSCFGKKNEIPNKPNRFCSVFSCRFYFFQNQKGSPRIRADMHRRLCLRTYNDEMLIGTYKRSFYLFGLFEHIQKKN